VTLITRESEIRFSKLARQHIHNAVRTHFRPYCDLDGISMPYIQTFVRNPACPLKEECDASIVANGRPSCLRYALVLLDNL